MTNSHRLQPVLDEIRFAHQYVDLLLADVVPGEWFWRPSEGVTHLAWQVGHLAVAEYGLTMRRIRGERPEDEAVVSNAFRELFGKGSTPAADATLYPTPEEILAVRERVHGAAEESLAALDDAELDAPIDPPHPAYSTKLGALYFCARHELVHAGQIALLRRLMGKGPLR